MSTFVRCVGCGEPLYGHPCRWCTCERCGNDLRDGYCFLCHSRNGDSFTYDSTPNSFDNPPDFSYPPPQPQYVPYSCELCGNDAHYGYDCPPQVPFVYNQDPCFNQNFDYFPQTSPSFPQQYPCCEDCGGPHETFQCQPMNYYEPNPCYDSNYSGFDQIEPPQFPVIHQPPQETSLEFLQDKRNLINSVQTFLRKFNRFSFYETPKVVSLAWETISEIEHAFEDKQYQPEGIFKTLEQVANLSTYPSRHFNSFCYDNDDDEEYTIAIIPEKPVNSLIMEDEHLDTILETKSDEFIKYSVENLVPTPSESEDLSDIEGECDMPDFDDSQTTNFSTFSNPLFDDSTSSDDESSHEEVIHEMSFKTYSNPLFDLDKEIISSEFNQIHNEDLDSTPKDIRFDAESYLLESLVNHDTLMASPPKIDFLLVEFADELTRLQLIPPGIYNINLDPEGDILFLESLLYDNSSPGPPKNLHAIPNTIIESLPTFPIPVEDSDSLREEIDIFPGPDDSIPPGIESDDYDSEGDENSTSLPEFE
ncbi:hypothetical protein Tco_0784059 [Tanacetum coccineum]